MLERDVKFKINQAFKDCPFIYSATVVTTGMNAAGTPDKLVCRLGHFFGLEVKRFKNSKISSLQISALRKIEQAQGISLVVSSETVESFIELFTNVNTKLIELDPYSLNEFLRKVEGRTCKSQ
jgi:hypothetical protein